MERALAVSVGAGLPANMARSDAAFAGKHAPTGLVPTGASAAACKARSHPRRGGSRRSAIIAGFEFIPSAMSADPKVLLADLLMSALKSVAPDLADTPILL